MSRTYLVDATLDELQEEITRRKNELYAPIDQTIELLNNTLLVNGYAPLPIYNLNCYDEIKRILMELKYEKINHGQKR